MKFDFKIQGYQTDAVDNIIQVFKGEQFQDCTYRFDHGSNKVRQRTLDTESGKGYDLDDELAYRNHPLTISNNQILENIRRIQNTDDIRTSESLSSGLGACSLDIEMETGTGKTYVYIKTMFELNKQYGWSKFIVVVPSIAIREGVRKSFEMTQDHFMEHYKKKARFFVYDSSNLQKLDDFSQNSGINVMIINSQAFAASLKEDGKSKESRIIYSERDEFGSRRPIDVISANNPIIILDEPQKLSGDTTQKALKKQFKPLFSLNFSATHKVQHNLIYSLDALDAYNEKLVKKIEVKGLEVRNLTGTSRYLYLESIVLDKVKAPRARLEMEVSHQNGTKRETRLLEEGDNLHVESNGLGAYKDVFITDISPEYGKVTFSDGTELMTGEVVGDNSEPNLRRVQIRETIISHFIKEEELFKMGIKCLSLFFIDEVSKYRQYDDDGNELLGDYGKYFEDEYRQIFAERKAMMDPEYVKYVESIPLESTHKGYFSIDKKTKRAINSTVGKKSEFSDDVDAYDLILRNKERLLSFEEPTRFIFSHSALSEGWDNPNVFQICALKHSDSTVRKRQEVGRGLRLCVNSQGTRMDLEECGANIHNINKLTVIASEGYDTFVRDLQKEISEVIRERPVRTGKEFFTGRRITVEGEQVVIDGPLAVKIYQHLLKNDLIDENEKPNDKCRQAVIEEGTLFIDPNSELFRYSDAVVDLVRSVIEGTLDDMFENGRKVKIRENRLNDNFEKAEFKALWNEINSKYSYRVDFDSEELIGKAVKSINENLAVSRLEYTLKTGSQKDTMDSDSVRSGDSFGSAKSDTKALKSTGSTVKYDLIGEIASACTLTRRTSAEILKRMEDHKFEMFKDNPEEFIQKVSKLVNEQKATMIVDHIEYNKLEDRYDSTIFTESKVECEPGKAYQGTKHIMDWVFTDGISDDNVEKRFAQAMDEANEVDVYAKLPKGFHIPTPVGNYSPDWAIAFNDSMGIKHIYFVAETKGSMDTMQLRPIERAKIECAKKLFNVEGSNVRYHKVDGFKTLLDLVRNTE